MSEGLETIKSHISELLKTFYNERLGDGNYDEQMEHVKTTLQALVSSALNRYGIKSTDYNSRNPENFINDYSPENVEVVIDFITDPSQSTAFESLSSYEGFPEKSWQTITINTYHLENGIDYPSGKVEWYKNEDSKKRVRAGCQYMSNVFHEVKHTLQRMLARSQISNKKALLYGKEFMLLTQYENDFYKKNGEFLTLESESIQEENSVMLELANALENNAFLEMIQFSHAEKISNVHRNLHKFAKLRFGEESNEYIDRNSLINELSNECIKGNPEFIKTYPILRKRI